MIRNGNFIEYNIRVLRSLIFPQKTATHVFRDEKSNLGGAKRNCKILVWRTRAELNGNSWSEGKNLTQLVEIKFLVFFLLKGIHKARSAIGNITAAKPPRINFKVAQ